MTLTDYNLSKLKIIDVKGRDLSMFITPRFEGHYVNNDYEKFSLDLLLKSLKPNSSFVDIGAHYGIYSLLAAKKVKNIKVYAVEPVDENFKILSKNIKLNKVKNIKIYQYAISNQVGLKEFNITEASDSAGFYDHPLTKTIKKIIIPTHTIDNLFKNKKIDFIKIDTEGNEIKVLEGMKSTLKHNPNIKLLIEFNPKCQKQAGYQPEELLNKLKDLNYDIFLIDDQKRKQFKITENIIEWKNLMNFNEYRNLLCIKKNTNFNILFFSHSSGLTGSERSLLELVDELLEKNVLITVVLPSDGPLKKLLDQRPVATEIIPFTWWARGGSLSQVEILKINSESHFNLLSSLPKLKSINPDVVYTNTISIPWGAITAILLGKPHIWHIREYGELDHDLHFDIGLTETKKFINATSNTVITNSKAIKDFYKDYIDEKKMTVAYNYIEIPKTLINQKQKNKIYRSKTSTKLLIFGTILPGKGQMDALKATYELIKKDMNLELAIVGHIPNSDYVQEIRDFIKNNNIEKLIHFNDFIDNPYPLIKSSDIILVCSKNEAFGRVTAEAMLMKKPVIGSNSGGTPELIKNNINGLLYQPGNNMDLSQKIEYLIKNQKKRKELGYNGYKFIKKNVYKKNYGGKIFEIINNATKSKPIFKNFDPLISSLTVAIVNNYAQLNHSLFELNILKKNLDKIQSSKVYKIWQFYCKIKDKILNNNGKA